MDRYDPTGASMYMPPKWQCWTGGQGSPGRSWNSRQPTAAQAAEEAAEIFGVLVESVKVEPFGRTMPITEEPWIDPMNG